jgi:hypothetical protein
MESDYYLIQQNLPYLKPLALKIICPLNLTHLKKFISIMAGQINVYKYHMEDNSREDLTRTLGVEKFNIYDSNFDKFREIICTYTSKYTITQYFKIYCLNGDFNIRKDIETFFMIDAVYKLKTVEYRSGNLFYSDVDNYKRLNNYGSEYEKFIGSKYEALGYFVEYNGIKKSFKDGGIDLIAIKKDLLVLVQCKNWSMANDYKLSQKDLRAFVGDCYLYMRNINLYSKKISFHFIVSHNDILTKSAEIFLKENDFIKFKTIPFEL